MKVSYLHIRNYKQFSDLELDLTYPKGHPKAGKPLEKICIIGQSGTGKTNLLDIIKKSTIDFAEQPKDSYLPFSEFVGKDTDDRYIRTKFQLLNTEYVETLFTSYESNIDGKLLNTLSKTVATIPFYEELSFTDYEKNYFVSALKKHSLETKKIIDVREMSENDKKRLEALEDTTANLLIKANGDYGVYPEEFEALYEQINRIKDRYKKKSVPSILENMKKKHLINKFIINIHEEKNSWKLLQESINNYNLEKKQYENKLFKEVRKDPKNAEKTIKAMGEWEKENENILEKIADDINSIIQRFNLELQIDEDTQSYEELKIKDLSNDTIIEYDNLSTGTKNLLSTFIPLKSHKPKDSIILIDEPEMSFYPNIQRQLTDLYMNVGENNQLIMATHSPLIASSFEPWEVVELKFDKNNQIFREEYYDKENDDYHVDNYTIDPRMLTWTGILTDVFDLTEDSNFSFREKKLMEYATLKAEIKAMKDISQKEEKFKELKKISKILGLNN